MEWHESTIRHINHLTEDERFYDWYEAVKNKGIDKMSEDLDHLVERLSRILLAEFRMKSEDYEKIMRLMQLAAMAGKTL
jgi:hypothetical protein